MSACLEILIVHYLCSLNILIGTGSVDCNEVLDIVLLHLHTILLILLGMFNFRCGNLAANLMVLGQPCFSRQTIK